MLRCSVPRTPWEVCNKARSTHQLYSFYAFAFWGLGAGAAQPAKRMSRVQTAGSNPISHPNTLLTLHLHDLSDFKATY